MMEKIYKVAILVVLVMIWCVLVWTVLAFLGIGPEELASIPIHS